MSIVIICQKSRPLPLFKFMMKKFRCKFRNVRGTIKFFKIVLGRMQAESKDHLLRSRAPDPRIKSNPIFSSGKIDSMFRIVIISLFTSSVKQILKNAVRKTQ